MCLASSREFSSRGLSSMLHINSLTTVILLLARTERVDDRCVAVIVHKVMWRIRPKAESITRRTFNYGTIEAMC